jgi:hypothetical protein|tara:strand:+ start:3738 stop:4154 length:417 start_codon:yes stop_codon:yes gene_type:complete
MAVNGIVWHLRRELQKGDAIWGRLYNDADGASFWTIENSAKPIPEGLHPCVKDYYHRGDYPTFEIIVEDRDRLLFHAANYASELEGCIAPGKDRGETEDGKLAVWNSKKAFNEFWDLVQDEEKFLLMIEDATEDSSDE